MKLQLCLFFTQILSIGTAALRLPKSIAIQFEERTSVTISEVKLRESGRHKRSTHLLPLSLSLHLTINGSTTHLNLTENPHLSTEVPTYLYDINDIVLHQTQWKTQTRKTKEGSGFYYDLSSAATFYIKCENIIGATQNSCQQYEMFGHFMTSAGQFVIEPTYADKPDTDLQEQVDTTKYRLVQLTDSLNLYNDYKRVDPTTLRYERKSTNHRRHRRATEYNMEVLLVTDYSVYKYWLNEAGFNPAQAVDDLSVFYAFMFNGIQMRYANIDSSAFDIRIKLAGLVISRSAGDSPWTETIKKVNSNGQETVSAAQALDLFSELVKEKKRTNSIPGHDHAMAFTRYNLETTATSDTTGYAYLGGACSDRGQSIVESEFNFVTHTIAAHELGHNLGAVHDGDGNNCLRQNQYIMAATSTALDANIVAQSSYLRNPWIFSSCSVDEMRQFVNDLNSSVNCLLTRDRPADTGDVNQYLEPKLGQIYNVHHQCERAIGPDSVACLANYGNYDNYDIICTGLWCLEPVNRTKCILILPAEGTTCGDEEWCINGECIYGTDAPSVNPNCIYGDDLIFRSSGAQNCSSYIAASPARCYGAISATCCETCDRFHTGVTGCEYGDRSSQCSQISVGGQCYTSSDTCCETCQNYETGIPGCRYGDRYDCTTITNARTCYGVTSQGNTSENCCETCNNFYSGNPDCPYGDRIPNCMSTDCVVYPQDVLYDCCRTCASFLTTPAPSTTEGSTTAPEKLPSWVIPAAAGGGGALFLIFIIAILCCCCRKGSGDAKVPKHVGQPPKVISNNEYGRVRAQQPYRSEVRKGNDNYAYTYAESYIDPNKVQGPKPTGVNRPLPPVSNAQTKIPQRGMSIDSSHVYVEIQDGHEYQELPESRPGGAEYQKLQSRKPSGVYAKLEPGKQQYTNRGYVR